MHGQQRAGGAKFDGEIAVAHGVHGILRELNLAAGVHEAEQLGDERAVERQRGTGNRAAAERADVHARVAVPEALAIAFEHLDVGEQMVREINGLRALQMRVAGNDDVGIFLAERDEGALQIGDFAEQAVISSRSQSRMSRATWSLRERAVCSFAPAGTRRVSSASMFMWTSSSSGFHLNLPAVISLPMASRPRTMAVIPFWSARRFCGASSAWAMEPRMSCRQSRQSKEMDSVNCATSAAGPRVKAAAAGDGRFLVLAHGQVLGARQAAQENVLMQ
jgi:hypothetical protein